MTKMKWLTKKTLLTMLEF